MTSERIIRNLIPSLKYRPYHRTTYGAVKNTPGITFVEVEKWHKDLNCAISELRNTLQKSFDVVDSDDNNSYFFAFANKEDAFLFKLKYPTLIYGASK